MQNVKVIKNIEFPAKANYEMIINNLEKIENVKFPKILNNTLKLYDVEKISDLKLPEIINGDLEISFGLEHKNELLKLPKYISGSLTLRGIYNLENILLPEEIGEFFDIPDLKGKECLEGIDISCVKDKRKIRYINKEYESAQSILEKFMKS